MIPKRALAIDWSGDLKAAHRKIWLCEVVEGEVRRLESGRSREEIAETLIEEAASDPSFVVGLDFAFSFPRRFLRKRAHRKVETVWDEATRLGEQWLAHCPFPFWGKPGKKKPGLHDLLYRRTELAIHAELGLRPMSAFQLGGVGAVGVGSIRGMPILKRLRDAGFSIWPFHEPALPLAIEIWPRIFMGRVKKTVRSARAEYLDANLPGVTGEPRVAAEASDDAFDALVSAVAMERDLDALGRLGVADAGIARLEGEIWRPAVS